MCKDKRSYQYYIGIGLILNAIAYLLYEAGLIIDLVKMGLLILGIVLEMIGLIKYRRSRIHGE